MLAFFREQSGQSGLCGYVHICGVGKHGRKGIFGKIVSARRHCSLCCLLQAKPSVRFSGKDLQCFVGFFGAYHGFHKRVACRGIVRRHPGGEPR